tara:strand:- start:116 stop:739 length:624 start_codon:yes stop_codon:yes gene_type:complete
MKKQMKYKKGGKGWMKSNPIQEAKDKKTAGRKAAGKLLAKVNKAQGGNYLFATPGSLAEVDEDGNLLPEFWKKGGMRYKNGGERTEKTDKQANKLVKKRKKIRDKKEKIESKDKKTKLGKWIKKKRLKRLDKREEKVQEKINKNPTAQEWRKEGEKKKNQKKKLKSFKDFFKKKKKKKGGAKKMYKSGGFNTDAGSWIEPSSVVSID